MSLLIIMKMPLQMIQCRYWWGQLKCSSQIMGSIAQKSLKAIVQMKKYT